MPEPVVERQADATFGVITVGSCDLAVREALDILAGRGVIADYMRIRGFPFGTAVRAFLASHPLHFVVEQNRDAQLRSLLVLETDVAKDALRSILVYGGFPLSAPDVVAGVTEQLGA